MIFGPKNDTFSHPNPPSIEGSFDKQPNAIIKDSLIKKNTLNISSLDIKSILHQFIQKLKANVSFKYLPIKNMSDLLKIINDESYLILESKSGKIEQVAIYIQQILQKMIICPDDSFRMTWNIFSMFHLIFCFIYIPFENSFELNNEFSMNFNYLTIFLFSLDILLNFLSGKFVKGFLVVDPKFLFESYLKSYFILDFLAVVYSFLGLLNNNNYLVNQNKIFTLYKFLILVKIPRFFSYSKIVSNYLNLENGVQEIIDMIKLICYSLFLAHILACFWHMCSFINKENNWLKSYQIENEVPSIKYLYSLYWTIVTIMTVGYGDIKPQNQFEALFAIFTIIFGCGLYAFNLNSLGIILQNHQRKKTQFNNNMRIINSFMNRKNIDIRLKRRVQEYLNFMWEEQQSNNNEEELSIINKLNETLKEELLLESYRGIFLNSPIFIKNFSEKSLRKIVKIIKEVKFIPGEEIFEEGVLDDCSLYFINSGSVELYLNRTDKNSQNIMKICKEGETFGEHSFFTGTSRDFSCRSIEMTSVLIINYEMALKILKENADDYESYCMIKEQILFQKNYSLIKYRCYYCRSLNHTIKNCNFLHFVPNIEKIIKRDEFYIEEPRRYFKRSLRPRFSRPSIVNKAHKFQKNQDKINITFSKYTSQFSDKSFPKWPIETMEFFENEDPNTNSMGVPSEPCYDYDKIADSNEEYKEEDYKETYKELHNLLTDNLDFDFQVRKNTLTIPQQNKSDFPTLTAVTKYSLTKETNKQNDKHNTNTETEAGKNELTHNVFDKMKNFSNYYPKMNYKKVLIHVKNSNKIKKHMNLLIDNNVQEEIFNKIQKLKKYSIYTGRFTDLIIRDLLKTTHFDYSSIGNISEFPSPIIIKKNKHFHSFFENKKNLQEWSIPSLVCMMKKKQKERKSFNVKKLRTKILHLMTKKKF